MKNISTSLILQIVALIFLIIIGYMMFNSGSKWDIISNELERARKELDSSKKVLKNTQSQLTESLHEIERMNLQKDIFKRERDSLLFDFKKNTAEDWDELTAIKDSIKKNHDKLVSERILLDSLFGRN